MKNLIIISLLFFSTLNVFATEEEQKAIVAALTGHSEIAPGVRIMQRGESDKKYVLSYLSDLLKNIGLIPKQHLYSTPREGINLYSVIPATINTDEYIVLGAHYDHPFGPGANDNATGVALIYMVAKSLIKQTERNQNVIIVFFDQEENGLIGAKNFVEKILDEKINVTSAHTVDQMGWDNDGDRAIEIELPTPELEKFYNCVNIKYNYNHKIQKTRVYTTDHHAFRMKKIPAVGITEEYAYGDTTPHYHTKNDTYETVNFAYLSSTTKYISSVFTEILNQKVCML